MLRDRRTQEAAARQAAHAEKIWRLVGRIARHWKCKALSGKNLRSVAAMKSGRYYALHTNTALTTMEESLCAPPEKLRNVPKPTPCSLSDALHRYRPSPSPLLQLLVF